MQKKFFKSGIVAFAIIGAMTFVGCGGEGGDDSLSSAKESKLKAPVVTQVGNILTWDDVEEATGYLVKFGSQEVYTSKTSCYLENYEEGGTFTVQAVEKENGEVVRSSPVSVEIDFPPMDYNEDNAVVYDFRTQKVVDISIPSTLHKCTIYGNGTHKNFSITIKQRTLPLVVELYDVNANYFGIEGEVRNDVPTSQLVTIKSLGEIGNQFTGVTGNAGYRGSDGGGLFQPGKNGGHGSQGGKGGQFNNVLIIGTRNITFTGGTGGKGGDGGNPGPAQTTHGDGGNGGAGGVGLATSKCFVYMEYATLLTTGGKGGAGGIGGGSWLEPDGSRGSEGIAFTGEKTEFAKPLIIRSQKTESADTATESSQDSQGSNSSLESSQSVEGSASNL